MAHKLQTLFVFNSNDIKRWISQLKNLECFLETFEVFSDEKVLLQCHFRFICKQFNQCLGAAVSFAHVS